MVRKLFIFFVLGYSTQSSASSMNALNLSTATQQGKIAYLELEGLQSHDKTKVRFLENEIACYPRSTNLNKKKWNCFIGIPADAPIGIQSLSLLINGSTVATLSVDISSCSFPVETLSLTQEKKSLFTQKGRDLELIKIRAALKTESEKRYWEKKFIWPLKGKFESDYGEKRMVDGKLLAGYHRGLDIGAPLGTIIKAIHHGKVILAAPFIEEGNMVMIDHGQGFISAYLHLSKILVHTGEFIHKGDPIGKVGSTGISTSPHLHFGTYLHSTPVDPRYFLIFPFEPS